MAMPAEARSIRAMKKTCLRSERLARLRWLKAMLHAPERPMPHRKRSIQSSRPIGAACLGVI